jgi:hypothetical protein
MTAEWVRAASGQLGMAQIYSADFRVPAAAHDRHRMSRSEHSDGSRDHRIFGKLNEWWDL